jgi:outer membrane protein OmpA-like peptidoglycan-associated protein
LGFSGYALAQEAQNESQSPGYKTAFKHNNAGDNWFINIGAGAQTIFGDNDAEAGLADRITVVPTLSVGKWFSPYWGVRLKGQGGTLHGFEQDGAYMQHLKYYNVHVDALWNLANYWGVYSTTKTFNFTPYLGLGVGHKFQIDDDVVAPKTNNYDPQYHRYSNVLSINPGIQFGFSLSKRVSLDFDLGAAIVPDYFDRVVHKAENEAIVTATGGLTFKLGKTTFDVVEPMDYGLINELNGKINALRAENDVLAKRPVSCPDCPQVAPAPVVNEINYVPNVVFFRLNSSKIDANQQISVYNTAEFIKETNEKIKVVGYADKNTGTGKYNLGLSEKRARAVAKELTTKYKIPSEKITVEWKGSDEQPYPQNNWNRVVIMSAQ